MSPLSFLMTAAQSFGISKARWLYLIFERYYIMYLEDKKEKVNNRIIFSKLFITYLLLFGKKEVYMFYLYNTILTIKILILFGTYTV